MIELKGMAWNHMRGFTSVVATAQRFEELNPDIRVTWEKRSLQAFADASLEELSAEYDLLVMDHPHVALAAEDSLLLPYDKYVSAEFLNDQAAHSVGHSHPSYHFNGQQWTLAIDAATPIATWREDLLQKHALTVPQTWEELLSMASTGKVGFAAIPIDLLMHSYMFCHAHGSALFQNQETFAETEALEHAIENLKQLVSLCDPIFQTLNPIQVAEKMSRSDDTSYCPFGYGYSNYSRMGYANHLLKAGDIVSYLGQPLCSALGGAGLGISSSTKHPQACMDYAAFTASPATQQGVFFEAGGQPGHRQAWESDHINQQTNDFFKDTLPALDRAILRPQYHGYMHFQDHASPVIHDGITGKQSVATTIEKMNAIFRESLNK
ncbi:ABC transporter substrate-binding protein [Rubritalea marina]|uniref:ABC transporter substrate-binding protein n=1 Tax=Rubritalea marina TaxID=361055 RepID=UPI000379884C|nr:ABC transporter substrate-binding protein [Rubritalea marina]